MACHYLQRNSDIHVGTDHFQHTVPDQRYQNQNLNKRRHLTQATAVKEKIKAIEWVLMQNLPKQV